MGMGGSSWKNRPNFFHCGCRDPVSFPIPGLALYLNPNSLDTEHAEVLIREEIAAPATLWPVM